MRYLGPLLLIAIPLLAVVFLGPAAGDLVAPLWSDPAWLAVGAAILIGVVLVFMLSVRHGGHTVIKE
jgi:hypothetical protein